MQSIRPNHYRLCVRISVLFLLVLIVQPNNGLAQEEYYSPGKNPTRYHRSKYWVQEGDILLRWQPLGLANVFDMNFTAGAAYAYSPNKSISLDVGYVFASIFGNLAREGRGIPPASGFIIRPAHRFYWGKRDAWFFDIAPAYKSVRYRADEQWVGRGMVNGVPAYEERMSFFTRKKVIMLEGHIGISYNLGWQGQLQFENWVGLGVRHRHYYADLPPDAGLTWGGGDFLGITNFGKGWVPSLPMGVRLSWNFNP